MIELINSNALNIPLADQSVHCVVTSPPYYGLRDYGTASWQGGDPQCSHKDAKLKNRFDYSFDKGTLSASGGIGNQLSNAGSNVARYKDICPSCGAVKIDDQLGMEKLHDCLGWATGDFCGHCYICHTLQWTREVKRVLRDDGTFWLNLGDSYAGSGKGIGSDHGKAVYTDIEVGDKIKIPAGLKPKDMIGIPWRVALALQMDGWYLRCDVIWNKTNPMPESTHDRPTKSHEYLFLFSKSRQYYYDYLAISEEAEWTQKRIEHTRGFAMKLGSTEVNEQHHGNRMTGRTMDGHRGPINEDGSLRSMVNEGIPIRNKRSVWTISTKPYPGAHFATFPTELPETCIKAGTSEKGCCPNCGNPWERVQERKQVLAGNSILAGRTLEEINLTGKWAGHQDANHKNLKGSPSAIAETVGWKPGCNCLERQIDNVLDAYSVPTPIPCVVFDPFVGSGTTLLVAKQLGRSGIGTDLSHAYLHEQAYKRLGLDKLKRWISG